MPSLRTKLEHLQRLATLQPHEKGDPLRQNEARTAAHIFLQTAIENGWKIELREPETPWHDMPRHAQEKLDSLERERARRKAAEKSRNQETDYFLITFKYRTTCRHCSHPIHEGTQGYWKRGAPCYHVECAPNEVYE